MIYHLYRRPKGLSEDSSLRKKVREASVPSLKLTHRMLIAYCRLRKWKDDHPSSDWSDCDMRMSVRDACDIGVLGIGLERLALAALAQLDRPENILKFQTRMAGRGPR